MRADADGREHRRERRGTCAGRMRREGRIDDEVAEAQLDARLRKGETGHLGLSLAAARWEEEVAVVLVVTVMMLSGIAS